MPPQHKNHSNFHFHTINRAIFDPHTKPSQFRSLHWNQVNPDHPHWNKVYLTTYTTNRSFSMSTLKPCHFRPVLLCVLYIRVHVPSNRYHMNTCTNSYLVLLLTCPYYCKNPENTAQVHIPCFIFYYMVIYMTTYDTGGRTSSRSTPPVRSISWCHTGPKS